MTKEGVVLMRGNRTKLNTLNAKTKDYLLEVLGEDKSCEHAKHKAVSDNAAAKDQPRKRNPQRRQRRKAHIPLRKQDESPLQPVA
jgi:hypothetical protein